MEGGEFKKYLIKIVDIFRIFSFWSVFDIFLRAPLTCICCIDGTLVALKKLILNPRKVQRHD